MRLLPALFLTLIAALPIRADDVPVTITPIADPAFTIGNAAATIDLKTHFTLPGVNTAQIMKMTTSLGKCLRGTAPHGRPQHRHQFPQLR